MSACCVYVSSDGGRAKTVDQKVCVCAVICPLILTIATENKLVFLCSDVKAGVKSNEHCSSVLLILIFFINIIF